MRILPLPPPMPRPRWPVEERDNECKGSEQLGMVKKWQETHVAGTEEREQGGRRVWRAGSGLEALARSLGIILSGLKWVLLCTCRGS